MTEAEQERASTLHLIVPSPDGRSILTHAASTPGALRLPEFLITTGEEMVAPILAAVAGFVGPDVPPLRIAPIDMDWDHGAANVVVETEAHRADAPDGHRWHAIADVQPEQVEPEAIRAVVGRWLDEQRGTPSPKRPLWSKPGFVPQARDWMTAQLEAAGTPLLEPPRLTSLWGIAAFFEGETAAGKVFFKSCAAIFPTEAQITLAIHRALPDVGPVVVAIDAERRWLLMRDVGGKPLGDAPPEQWVAGLEAFGAVQRAWPEAARRLPASERIELEDRTPARLAETLPGLVDNAVLADLEPEHRARLRAELPRFVDGCHEIAALGPSNTLVHGDFHPWNVHLEGDRTPIIDWSDTAIGHPFFDLPTFLGRTKDVAQRHQMLDAYLVGWTGEDSDLDPERLQRAAMLGLILGSLYQVESYRRITESLDLDDMWDLDSGAPSWVRRAFAWLDMGLEATGKV